MRMEEPAATEAATDSGRGNKETLLKNGEVKYNEKANTKNQIAGR